MRFLDVPRRNAARCLFGAVIAAGTIAGAVRVLGPAAWLGLTATARAGTTEPAQTGQADAAGPATPPGVHTPRAGAPRSGAPRSGGPNIELTATQLQSFKIGSVGTQAFPRQVQVVGSIDFDEDMETQVFTNYQGRIVSLFAKVGDDVQKGQKLFTIDSPDLVQAESTLINTAGVLRLTTRALNRARDLYGAKGLAQKDYDQAVADQQGAEGNYKAAADAVRIFGKTSADIETIVATKAIDSTLVVSSPITGRVTVRNAAPGLFVQPGNTPAPFTVADISTMWMLGDVPEIDSAAIKLGQHVNVSVMAHPDQVFEGTITTVAATVDPTVHTLLVRSEVRDPAHELLPGMFANLVISTGSPVTAAAVPANAVVREGDGTMAVWVTTDRHTFTQRQVTIGLRHNGYDQILDGLKQGELVVTDNAVFLDNMLTAGPTD
jgi:cobalt-zinc-cadmium efflux system membrane fusion protein